MILAGDIGGTKTVLGLISSQKGAHNPIALRRFSSSDYSTFTAMIGDYLEGKDVSLEAVSIGAAGPVSEDRVEGTNLPWDVESAVISEMLNEIPVFLINDLEAIASAIPTLEPNDLEIIKPGENRDKSPIAILAPGTGLGEAFLFWDGNRYRAIPSEGGHTDFAPATSEEMALLDFLRTKYRHVSYERVCSGFGIPNLYIFFRDTARFSEPEWLRDELDMKEDWTPVIVQSAMDESADICQATLDMFMGILGSEAGNLALQVLASGGVYLAGGIPPRILPKLKSKPFPDGFTRKGRLSSILLQIQVNVVTNPLAALFGAASHGLVKVQS